jgi:hypothetical protein
VLVSFTMTLAGPVPTPAHPTVAHPFPSLGKAALPGEGINPTVDPSFALLHAAG